MHRASDVDGAKRHALSEPQRADIEAGLAAATGPGCDERAQRGRTMRSGNGCVMALGFAVVLVGCAAGVCCLYYVGWFREVAVVWEGRG